MFQVTKRCFAIMLCLVLILALSMPVLAAEAEPETPQHALAYGRITKGVTFREGPSTAYGKLDSIAKGTDVLVMNSSGSWWQIEYDGQVGYVHKNYITLTSEPPAAEVALSSAVNMAAPAAEPAPVANITVSGKDPLADKIAKGQSINRDCIGWIEVPNTKISDPILYRSDFYYAYHNIYNKKSNDGVYTHFATLQRNNPLYGHNLRKSNEGFHEMHHLQEGALGKSTCMSNSCSKKVSGNASWYKTEEGRVWNISLFGKTKWEVFAMYEVKQDEPKTTLSFNYTPSISRYWLDYQLQRSQINFGVSVSESDTILTIITCGDNYDSASAQSRLYVFLKCVG